MSDITTTRIFTDGEKGITAAKMNDIVGGSVIQPDFVASKPLASTVNPADNLLVLLAGGTYAKAPFSTITGSAAGQIPLADATQNGMLRQVSGLATDVVDGTNHCVPVAGMSGITQMRLRSFNAIGNSTFEVDQRSVGALVAGANGTVLDRWPVTKTGTMVVSTQRITIPGASPVVVPGTNFVISANALSVKITTAQASLATGDFLTISQFVEGPQFRELSFDVHSISLLVRSSVAGLKFGLTLRDPVTSTKSLAKLCTLSTANTWTLITCPNLPVWPSGNFTVTPGANGYMLYLVLAAGTAATSPANDAWQNGSFLGAVGQDSLAATLNATFDVAFVQHEPGPLCTTLIDKPFIQNNDECLRYYQKTFDYAVAPGAVTAVGARSLLAYQAATAAQGVAPFQKSMAKIPTVILYDHINGAAGSVADQSGTHHTSAVVAAPGLSSNSFYSISYATATTGIMPVYFHYTADTGW